MAATRDEIMSWLSCARKKNKGFLIVVCDTFEYDDYPVYCIDEKECLEKYNEYNGKDMQRIMEVYDLSIPIEIQIDENRAFHLPKEKNT